MLHLDDDNEIIGYKFVHLGKMMEKIGKGMDAKNEDFKKLKVNTEELTMQLNLLTQEMNN